MPECHICVLNFYLSVGGLIQLNFHLKMIDIVVDFIFNISTAFALIKYKCRPRERSKVHRYLIYLHL